MQKQLEAKKDYNPSQIEKKWQVLWEKEKIYSPDLKSAQKRFYNLMMFPYPSAEGMHVGNMYAFTGSDVYGRFKRMQGYSVFEPIGLDGFGIHSENYAIKIGKHPVEQAKISEKNFYRQLKSIGNGFDWSRTVETYKPNYYKWTQWIFIQLFKAGLAYRKKAPVNFCPSCKTVLSDEQVVSNSHVARRTSHVAERKAKSDELSVNACERCSTEVEKKELEQWFFRITKYADRLLANIPKLDWSKKVKIAQEQWIGRSEGTLIRFELRASSFELRELEVFTTRPDTLYGATFLVLAPEHPLVNVILSEAKDLPHPNPLPFREREWERVRDEIRSYVEKAKNKNTQERMGKKEKTGLPGEALAKSGVFTGLYAINPLNNEKLPIWIADYVLMEYGTGAIMAVPAHDQRDYEFAKQYNLPIKTVILGSGATPESKTDSGQARMTKAYIGEGKIINSGDWNGWKTPDSMNKIIEYLEQKGKGERKSTYHLRDWLISRQRYWGPPIPVVFCENCAKRIKDKGLRIKDELSKGELENPGWIAIKEENLPVELPFIKDYKPLGTGKAPLASHPEFYKAACPECGSAARRETDVSDTFLDSAWYFLRYVSTDIDSRVFDPEIVKKWLPVNMYIGGAEHSVLHLLYSRFITMALKDMEYLGFEEPFAKFRAHGLIVKDGAKMSKSKGNVVIPDEYIKKFGADTVRAYLMFSGPFDQGGDFRDSGIEGMHRFLTRVYRLAKESIEPRALPRRQAGQSSEPSRQSLQMMHRTIKSVTEDIESLSYNTAIARIMEYYNHLSSKLKVLPRRQAGQSSKLSTEEIEVLVKLLAPFAPFMAEELYQRIRNKELGMKDNQKKIHHSSFPACNCLRKAMAGRIIHHSVHLQPWPSYDPKLLVQNQATIVVQVNGKLRGNIVATSDKLSAKSYIEQLAKTDEKVLRYIEGKKIQKVVYVEGRVINFVTN